MVCSRGKKKYTNTNVTYKLKNKYKHAHKHIQILKGQKYTEKADVFSFAIIMWELVNRVYTKKYKPPFSKYTVSRHEMKRAITTGERLPLPPNLPGPLRSLIQDVKTQKHKNTNKNKTHKTNIIDINININTIK